MKMEIADRAESTKKFFRALLPLYIRQYQIGDFTNKGEELQPKSGNRIDWSLVKLSSRFFHHLDIDKNEQY